jgi:hypothetical protein
MKTVPASRAALFTTALSLAGWKTGWAQGITPTAPATPSAGATQSGAVTTVVVVTSVIAVLVVLGLLIKLLDLKRKRDSEAIVVQARISDAILRDPRLFSLAITPTAHVPLWTGSPVTVEVAGHVPSEDLLQASMELVEREASQLGPDIRIESKVNVEPAMARQSA